jgi:hypothetical protein
MVLSRSVVFCSGRRCGIGFIGGSVFSRIPAVVCALKGFLVDENAPGLVVSLNLGPTARFFVYFVVLIVLL